MKTEISYEVLENEIIQAFGESRIMVLATSADNRVTARSMSCVFDGIKIIFQIGLSTTKGSQIGKNPLVALCSSNIQVEGTARILGHSLENAWFREHYGKMHPGSFKAYSGLEDERVVEVTPSLITLWKYSAEGLPFTDTLDVKEKKAFRKYYEICK